MIFHRPFLRGLSREEICVSKSIGIYHFALFYFVFEGKFPSTSPRGAYIWRGDHLMEGFCVTGFGGLEGLIFGILWYLLARRRDATHPIPFQMFLLYLPFIHFEFFLLLLMLSNRTLCRESVKLTPPITSVAGVLNERGKGELKYTRTQGVHVDSLHVCMNGLHRRHVKGRGEILLTHPLCSCSPKFSLPPSRDLMPVAITIH